MLSEFIIRSIISLDIYLIIHRENQACKQCNMTLQYMKVIEFLQSELRPKRIKVSYITCIHNNYAVIDVLF